MSEDMGISSPVVEGPPGLPPKDPGLWSWLSAQFYDRFLAGTEAAGLGRWRAELLGGIGGVALELGGGTGTNLAYYPHDLEQLIVAEPNPHMREKLEARLAEWPGRGRAMAARAEGIPLMDESVDVVVSTLVCCTVGNPARSLSEAYRVLRPGGALVFIEHVAAEEGSSRLKWQRRIEPLWLRFAGGCHLTRPTGQLIEEAGFALEDVRAESMRKAPPFVRPTLRGVARKRG